MSTAVARQYPVRQKPLTLASPLGTLQAMRGGFKMVATAQAAPAARITSYSRLLPCATDSASSRVRTGAFARLTVCFGCCCVGCGPGGGKRWCWSSRPPSIVGIAKGYGDAGAVARGSDVSFRPTQLSINGSCVSARWAVDCVLPLRSTLLGMRLQQDHLQDCTGACKSTGRDPPPHPQLRRMASGHGFLPCMPAVPGRPTAP